MIIWKITFIVGICVFSIPTVADEPLQIAWKDLRPVETVTDPYEKLSPEQQERDDVKSIDTLCARYEEIKAELAKVIIGQDQDDIGQRQRG